MSSSGETVPQFADRQQMWAELHVERISDPSPALQEYTEALSGVYANGGARSATFEVSPHKVFDWYASRNQFHEMGFFCDFWKLEPAKSFLGGHVLDLNFFDRSVFAESTPFVLAGTFAAALAEGGAYRRYDGGSLGAKRLGDVAAVELIGDAYDHTLVYLSHVAWADFFCDIAWDRTWLVHNKKNRRLTWIIATDTD